MSFLAPTMLHKIAAIVYGLTVPGHVIVGFQKVYPALGQIRTDKPDARGGETGARLCWNFVTTALVAQALFHWKWSRLGAADSREEILAFLALTGHVIYNGLGYLRVGEGAGPILLLASVTGLTAIVADLQKSG